MYEERTDWVDTPKPPAKPGETPVKAADILRWERAHAEAHEQLDGRLSEASLNATYVPDSRRVIEQAPAIAKLHRRLSQPGSANANLLVVGDSTGDGADRWPRQLCNHLAAAYPNHTVIWAPWADASKTFPAGSRVTVQAGTNGKTITVWNASVSGEVIGYAQNNHGTIRSGLSAGGALPPDVIVFNYGHNSPQLDADYRAILIEAINVYTGYYPNAAVVQIAQNPRAVTDFSYANDQNKQAVIAQLALDEGHVLVDVNQDWVRYGDYTTDLLNADGLHPNANGSQRIADLVWQHIKPQPRTTFPSRQPRDDRVWVPATVFYASEGTPELALRGALPAWSLDAAVQESVVASVTYPNDWTMVNVFGLFGSAGTAGTAVCRVNHIYLGDQAATFLNGALPAFTSGTKANVAATATSNGQAPIRLANRTAYSSRPLALQVQRVAADAADALTTDLLFYGLMIAKAS